MIENHLLTTNKIMIGRRPSVAPRLSKTILNPINLHDILPPEDANKLLDEPSFSPYKIIEEEDENSSDNYDSENPNGSLSKSSKDDKGDHNYSSKGNGGSSKSKSKSKGNNLCSTSSAFDKMGLIMKVLVTSIEKLHKHNETAVAKGLEWYYYIQVIIKFKNKSYIYFNIF